MAYDVGCCGLNQRSRKTRFVAGVWLRFPL